MEAPQTSSLQEQPSLGVLLKTIDRDVTEWDEKTYWRIASVDLTPEQESFILNPPDTFSHQREVLALHWHPEFIPLPLIRERINTLFPNREEELIIPTDHNVLQEYNEFTGVEVDCFSPEFNLKVQLLVHFETEKLATPRSNVFRAMLDHTFQYRSSQLYGFLDALLKPEHNEWLEQAAKNTGATAELIDFVKLFATKIAKLVDQHRSKTPSASLKNKLIRDYFNSLRENYDEHTIDRAQVFLKAVKKIVKRNFKLEYFYRTQEVIEEVRLLGGGIIIPHPEQFWPILLAGYDVDGYEIWNPQSREYTEFLISVVNRHNEAQRNKDRRLLVTMGDDCHMGEKVKDPRYWDREKAFRELGVQPPWNDLTINKSLILAKFSRSQVIAEYRDRLLS